MIRIAFILVAFATLLHMQAFTPAVAETVIRIEYHPDPCQEVSAIGKGKKAKIGNTTISLQPFYYAACEKVRQSIVDAISNRAKAVRTEVEGEVHSRIEAFYERFRAWLAGGVYQALDENTRKTIGSDQYFEKWLARPDRPLSEYVNHYIVAELPAFSAAIEKYQNDNSREIVSGLQAIWGNAKKRLADIIAAREELDAASPETKYTDILRKHGLSADWLDKLTEYEGRFDLLDKNYDIIETARLVHGAFTAEDYSGKIEGMFSIMEKLGSTMASSKVPGISLLGTLVESYGKLAKEVLKQANALKKAIRSREGFCLGLATHTITDKRGEAFVALAGKGVQACPLDEQRPLLKDIYYQAEPNNENQLYFWTGKGFVKGIETGGGRSGVDAARNLIRDAVSLGFSEYIGKDVDLTTIINFYNAPYGPKYYINDLPGHRPKSGLDGIISEGVAVFDAISSRIRSLRDHVSLDQNCGESEFARLIEGEAGLRLSAFPLDDAFLLDKLKTSYAVGFVQMHSSGGSGLRAESYRRYRKIWKRLAKLSMVTLEGSVVDKNRISEPCEKCANASISISVTQGREMQGCQISNADDKGQFLARIITRSTGVLIQSEARVGEISSEKDRPIDAWHLNLNDVSPPFERHFSYKLLMPFEPDVSPDDALGVLRGLHGEAMKAKANGEAACDVARTTAKAGQAQLKVVESSVSTIETRVKSLMPGVSQLTSALSRLNSLTNKAEQSATKVVESKKKAEKAALLACDKARGIRKEDDENIRRRVFSEIQIAAKEADTHASAAKSGFEQTGKAASEAESLARENETLALDVGKLPNELAEVAQMISVVTAKAETLPTEIETIRAAKKVLDDIISRAQAAHKTAIALIAQFDANRRGELKIEADRLLAEIKSAAGGLASCITELTKAQTGLTKATQELTSTVESVKTQVSTSKLKKDGVSARERLLIDSKKARSSADVAEVFEEVAASTAADAQRCLALAKSAMNQDLDDDKSAAVEAAISICRFKQARSLLLTMKQHPKYAKLSSLYRNAVAREGKTLAEFERAQSLQKAGDDAGARSALQAARENTRCDNFRSKIDAALAALAGAAGDETVAKARSAIAACKFKIARSLITKLGSTDHEAHGEIKALYNAAVERERRTSALWRQAKAAQKGGNLAKAIGLLELARENTKCRNFVARINSALGNLRNSPDAVTSTEPEVPPSEDAAGWTGPWRGTLRLKGLQLNGRSMSVAGALELLAKSAKPGSKRKKHDGSIAGRAGAVAGGVGEAFGEIFAHLVAYVFGAMDVVAEGVELSFKLENQGGAYRVVLIGQNDDAKKLEKNIPVFVETGDGRLKLNHLLNDGDGRVSAQFKKNETGDRLLLSVVFNGKNTPKPKDAFQIRTVQLTLAGELTHGSIPAETMMKTIENQVKNAAKRYLPKK